MKKIFIMLFIFCNLCFSASLTIPNKVIAISVSKMLPVKKETMASKLEVQYKDFYIEDNRLKVVLDYVGSALGKNLEGELILSSDLEYDSNLKELYFKELKIEKVKNGDVEYDIENNKVLKLIIYAVSKSIESKSFFKLKENSLTKNLDIKDVDIVKNNIIIVF